MTTLAELEAVLTVARMRSFRAAASALGVSTSAVSHTIAGLEGRLGVRLFNRTTRSVAVTDAGAEFVANIGPALLEIRHAMETAGSSGATPAGSLRINTSAAAALRCMPLFMDFSARFPAVHLDIVTEGRLIDIVADGYDAGIRLADSVPQDMISVQIEPALRYVVVGTPALIETIGVPALPADLRSKPCIRMRLPSGAPFRWEFVHQGVPLEIDVRGRLTLDNPGLVREAALGGLGLAYLAEWHVAEDLASGRLMQVLADAALTVEGLCLYYPGRRHVPPSLRALVEMARERFRPGSAPRTT
jgi:DNA-binding transcriptional LysR family regulator